MGPVTDIGGWNEGLQGNPNMSSNLIQKGPCMGQTWPIPDAHGHGALVTAERYFGIDVRTGRRFFLGLSTPLRVQAFIINASMKQLRTYQTRLVE